MEKSPLTGWLAEVTAAAVVVRSGDINAEAHGNLWSFSLSHEQATAVSAAEVEEFVEAIVAARGRWLKARGGGPMLLYCWHDEQAGQLRLSLVSASHGRLPFGREIHPVEDLAVVIRGFLSSPYLECIPWEELRPLAAEEVESERPPHVLPVWVARIPEPSRIG